MLDVLTLLAQEAPPQPQGVWEFILDNAVALMIIFIFLTAVVGTFINARKRDRCLKKFAGFEVAIREQAGRSIWGRLRVFSKGIEVLFTDPSRAASEGFAKRSFLYYQNELSRLLIVARCVDEIGDPRELARRRRQLRQMARPGLVTRVRRWAQNLVNTFRDAIVQSLGVVVSQTQKTATSTFAKTGAGSMSSVGTMLVGEMGNAYEPMLEQYFGDPVVAEIVNPADPAKRIVEFSGYLGEYSADYFLLVDCTHTEELPLRIPADGHGPLDRHLRGELAGRKLTLHHGGAFAATVTAVRWGEAAEYLDVRLTPGEDATIELAEGPPDGTSVTVTVRVMRQLDLIAPRSIAAVRHAGTEPDK
ncbi:MAG: hypothetical protein JXL80_01005 [Planctomycetes bacterium]|nr:hypothetical protein [Planctomycetota bacterium]